MKRDQFLRHISSVGNATLYCNEKKGVRKRYSHLTSAGFTAEEREGNPLQGTFFFFHFFLAEESIDPSESFFENLL